MLIDDFYTDIDKSYFYLGLISQVYRDNSIAQIENLSWIKHRKIKAENLIPNTINYFVLIDSVQGLFIGELYQSKIANSNSAHDSIKNGKFEDVYSEIGIDIVGIMKSGDHYFSLPGFQNVGITEKVYIANQEVIKKYFDSIEIKDSLNIENEIIPFANYSSIKDQLIHIKPSTLFNRHLLAVGATNSGKSTSALSILDKLIKDNKKLLIIDPTGEYRDSFRDTEVTKLTLGADTIMSVSEVSIQQWAMIFETNDATQPAVLSNAILSLRYQKKAGIPGIYIKENQYVSLVQNHMASVLDTDKDFVLSDLPLQISVETSNIGGRGNNKIYVQNDFNFNAIQWLVQKVQYKLSNNSFLRFFSDDQSMKNLMNEVDKFIETPKTSLYIDASEIGMSDSIGGMIIDLICNYLINKEKSKINPFVIFIDEVHRYTARNKPENDYFTGLSNIAREGRKKGIFLFLTTQNPQDVPAVILGQVGTLLIHRLTHSDEIRAIQNHLSMNNIGQIKNLCKGEAILSSINLLQDVHLNIEKCGRPHENTTPLL
ncbi:ATP-binding protein [Enterococcus hirae]|uniref:ATP-binding protein n=1 Tax=Enterococcus hirae TaxID=1354 RepID=UPI002DB7159A|nr:ATP-binding protein [Enterococcus hirae]MEB7406493.1 ATP-binding protein [Enterococcus hirae]